MLGRLFKRAASCDFSLYSSNHKGHQHSGQGSQLRFCTAESFITCPCPSRLESSSKDMETWRHAVDYTRAGAYSVRKYLMQERLFRGAWQLPPLQTGDQLWVLDQHGYSPRQWSKTEVVDEADGFDSYLVSYLRRNILAILLMKKAAKRASR